MAKSAWIIPIVSVDAAGDSYFREFSIPLDAPTSVGVLSEKIPCIGIYFRETPSNYDLDLHTAPRKQFIVNLDSSVELTSSKGDVRVMPTGTVFYVEDITGKGHKSRTIEGKVRKSVFLPVPEDFKIESLLKH